MITGTPTQAAPLRSGCRRTRTAHARAKDLSLFVFAPLGIQTLFDKTPPATGLTAKRLVGQPLVTGVKAVGGRGPFTFSSEGEMPPGITLDPATGTSPAQEQRPAEYAFTVTITDATGAKASVPWKITILPLLSFVPNGEGTPPDTSASDPLDLKTTGASKTRSFGFTASVPPASRSTRPPARSPGRSAGPSR